jgi:hypothetical protein
MFQVEDLKSLLKELPEDTRESEPSEMQTCFGMANQPYIFGYAPSHDGPNRHPPAEQIPLYWHLFKENCDRLMKVLHVPTVEPLILHAAKNLDLVAQRLQPLMFAIYFSVVLSLSELECLQLLGGKKDNLLRSYKSAMDQALAQTAFLETEEMIVLQAFVIFLVGLRRHCSIRLMWTLTALAVRLAQNAGIHRDGTHFNLLPFEVEMRRRLWWSICILDSRASEDSGYDAAIPHEGVDTKIPLNVNDSDLLPCMTEFPKARTGKTDMTFSMIRFEAFKTFRRLQYASAGTVGKCGKFHAAESLAVKSEWISKCQENIEMLCLKHSDISDPFSWYTAAISRILIAKLWLVAHHPYLRRDSCAGLPQDTKDRLFITAIQAVECWLLLNSEQRTQNWRWLCETYIQWYALTFLLSELCVRTQGDEVDRAWNAIDAALELGERLSLVSSRPKEAATSQCQKTLDETHGDAYKPLSRLLRKARTARDLTLSSTESWSGSQVLGGREPVLSDPPTQLMVGEALNLPDIGFSDLTFANSIFPSGTVPFPNDILEACEEMSYNSDNYHLSYPFIEPDMSAWAQ